MRTLRSNEHHLSHKLSEVLKSLKIKVEGPIWHEVLQMANKRMVQMQEGVINRQFVRELKPMLAIGKALNWEMIGAGLMSRINLVNVIKIHGKKAM
jgi:hypothetical protein